MSDFAGTLSAIVAVELGKNDPEISGMVIERLLHSLAFSISMTCRGNREGMEEMITGAEHYLTETALGFEPFSEFMAKSRGAK